MTNHMRIQREIKPFTQPDPANLGVTVAQSTDPVIFLFQRTEHILHMGKESHFISGCKKYIKRPGHKLFYFRLTVTGLPQTNFKLP